LFLRQIRKDALEKIPDELWRKFKQKFKNTKSRGVRARIQGVAGERLGYLRRFPETSAFNYARFKTNVHTRNRSDCRLIATQAKKESDTAARD
jgi:hypothetical protein